MRNAEYKYFTIREGPQVGGAKAKDYLVVNRRSGDLLGLIKWFAPWRQYCLMPEPGTVWSADCLADIENFMARIGEEPRASLHGKEGK